MATARVGIALTVLFVAAFSAAAGDLETLVKWMSGSFSSEAQSLEDDAFFDIRLNPFCFDPG